MICMAEVQAKPIEWLWPNWLAIGKVSMLSGKGGKGKSTILCDLVARTTTGAAWPDHVSGGKPGSVVILAAEDDAADTLKPRLVAAHADMTRVFNIRSAYSDGQQRRSFNVQTDLAALEAEIERLGDVRLVIIDPITSYLGRVDSHKNADVRAVLEPIGEFAARQRVAVVCNNHFSKSGGDANDRMIGSVAFVNYVRTALIVTPDAENELRLLLLPAKNNIAAIKYGLAYSIGSRLITADNTEILTSEILWETEPVKITADDALAALATDSDSRTGKAEAIDFFAVCFCCGPGTRRRHQTPGVRSWHHCQGPSNGERRSWDQTREDRNAGRVALDTPEDALRPRRCSRSDQGTFDMKGHLRGEKEPVAVRLRWASKGYLNDED
jgi:putative DNA primase/helicase